MQKKQNVLKWVLFHVCVHRYLDLYLANIWVFPLEVIIVELGVKMSG